MGHTLRQVVIIVIIVGEFPNLESSRNVNMISLRVGIKLEQSPQTIVKRVDENAQQIHRKKTKTTEICNALTIKLT